MSGEDDKNRAVVMEHHHHQSPPPPPQYGTFQGVSNYPPPPYPPPRPPPTGTSGFPQPAPPPGALDDRSSQHYVQGHQTTPGHAAAEGRPIRERRLPCCGIGIGWFLFIIGFFLGAIPWYIGAFILLCARIDPREKPGYIACTIAAAVATIAIIFGVTKGSGAW